MKKSVKLLILVLVLALAIGGLVAVNKYNAKQEEAEAQAEAEIIAATVDTTAVTSIRWATENADVTLLKNEDGNWCCKDDEALPLDKAVPEGMLNAVATVSATMLISDAPTDIAQYGLEEAPVTVVLTAKDGTETTLKFGNTAPSTDIYFCSSLSKSVYLVSADYLGTFSRTPENIVEIEKFPTVETIHSVEIKNKESSYTVSAEPANDDTGTAYSVLIGNEGTLLTDESADALESEVNGLYFDSCVSYKGDFKKYGLDTPAHQVTVNYTDAEGKSDSFTLLLGNMNEDESAYYATLQGSKQVYTVYVSNVNTLTTADPADLCNETATED